MPTIDNRESYKRTPTTIKNSLTDYITKNIIIDDELSMDEKIEKSIKSIQKLKKKRREIW